MAGTATGGGRGAQTVTALLSDVGTRQHHLADMGRITEFVFLHLTFLQQGTFLE